MKQRQKYKDSGLQWVGQIPEHWEVKKIKYIIEINKQVLSEETSPDRVINYLDISNASETRGDISTIHLNFEDAPSRARRVPEKYDVLISTVRTYLKVIVFVENTFDNTLVASTGFVVLHPTKKINSKFLYYLAKSEPFIQKVVSESKGVAYPAINPSELSNLPSWYPPIGEQNLIVKYLDPQTQNIDSLVEKRKQMRELLKEERIAIINQAVSKGINPTVKMKYSGIDWIGKIPRHWEVKKLKYVASLREETNENSDFKIAVENIEIGSGKLINMNEEKDYEGQLSAFEKGDIIFNKLRPYLHKVYFAEQDGGIFGELLIIYSKGKLLSKFLFYKLFSKLFINIVDGSTQGTKMPRANWNDFICKLPIAFPENKKEQSEIVQYIISGTSKIDNTLIKIEKEISLLEEYKTALISEVVTGKIDVRAVA